MLLYENCAQLTPNPLRHSDSAARTLHENPFLQILPSSAWIPLSWKEECPKHDGAHVALFRRSTFFFPARERSFRGLWPRRSSTSARRISATDQAWATQPRGVWGVSASKISETCPRQASLRWRSIPAKNWRALRRATVVPPWVLTHAVTNGPRRNGHTVP